MTTASNKLSEITKRFWLWAVFVFFGVVSLGQFERIELRQLPAFYVHDVVLAVFVGWQATQHDWRQLLLRLLKKFPTLGWICLGWAGAGLALAAISGSSIIYPLATLARLTLYILAAVGALTQLKKASISPLLLRSGIHFFFAMLLIFGVLQYFLVPDTRFLFFLGWDDHYYRLISSLFDPGFTGLCFVLGYLFFQETFRFPKQFAPLKVVLSLGMIVGLLFTYSRASYLAFGVVMLFLTWKHWQQGQLQRATSQAFLLAVFVLSLFFLPQPGGEGVKLGRTSTITARAITAQQSFTNFNTISSFVIGNGLFVPPTQSTSLYTGTTSHAKVTDNWVIAILSGTGVVGVFLVFGLLFQTLRWAFSKQHSFLWIAILAVLVHGLFNASVTYPFVWIVLLSWGVLTLES